MGMWSGATGQQFEQVHATDQAPAVPDPGWNPLCRPQRHPGRMAAAYDDERERVRDDSTGTRRTPATAFYEFRTGQWVLLVHRRYVIHREDIDKHEPRLQLVAGR